MQPRKSGDIDELRAIIARELSQAVGGDDSTLSEQRRIAMQYYEGEPFGDEMDGRSQIVMRTVMEAVEWVVPALLRIFTASDQIANIEPNREQDEKAAEQATKYINHIFHRDNDGFMILHDWFKDALICRVGWVKRWWDESKEEETTSYTGLTREEYDAVLGKDQDVEVLEESSRQLPADEFNEDRPFPAPIVVWDCKLRVTRENSRVRIETVPPEEVLFSRRAKRGDIPFVCHRPMKTVSELLAQGYDEDTLRQIQLTGAGDTSPERIARFADTAQSLPDDRSDFSMRSLWIEENYVRWDRDGDGIAELLKVVTVQGGGTILTKGGKEDIEDVDEIPLVPICPVPTPHKLAGHSLADLVMDLQWYKSVLLRQIFDNIYLSNMPEVVIGQGAVTDETYDDLLMRRPGGVIRVKDVTQIVPHVVPFVAEKAFGLVEYIDQTAEVRTGVSRHNQGLNPDDLNKTATGVNLIQQAAAQRVELIARIFGEGVRELVRGILGLVQRHQQQERIIHVTGDWLTMDPRQWRNQMQVTVSVGLGTGNRDQILQHLMTILQLQQGIVTLQGGIQGPLVTAKNAYDALERLTENAGFKESFFTDPSAPPSPDQAQQQQMPKPDPKMMQAQAQIQAAQAKAQADVQAKGMQAQVKMALDQQQAEHAMELERTKAMHDMQLAQIREQAKAAREEHEIELRAAAGVYTSDDRMPSRRGAE